MPPPPTHRAMVKSTTPQPSAALRSRHRRGTGPRRRRRVGPVGRERCDPPRTCADGIREVSATTLEAATAAGSSTFQLIRKVQIPMAAKAIALATNQGLIYVLAMVVVGGLVGAGALGNQVVTGFSQEQRWGKGFAAGLAIVLLGVMLDRVTQRVAQRVDPGAPRR